MYQLFELGGMLLRYLVAGKSVKIFKKPEEAYTYVDLEDDNDIGEGGTNRDEGPEDDGGSIEFVVQLMDATNNDD